MAHKRLECLSQVLAGVLPSPLPTNSHKLVKLYYLYLAADARLVPGETHADKRVATNSDS